MEEKKRKGGKETRTVRGLRRAEGEDNEMKKRKRKVIHEALYLATFAPF